VLRIFATIFLLLVVAGPVRAQEQWQGRVLHACEDEEGYPPFTYAEPEDGAKGYAVELMNEALAGTGMRLDLSFLPMARCNASLDNGTMDFSMEDYWDPDMAKRWLLSDSLYDGTFVLFYDRQRHPDGISPAEVVAHPGDHRGCGLLGESYEIFPPGQIYSRAHLYSEAFDHVLSGMCEFAPDQLEFGLAYKLHGKKLLGDGRMGYVLFPVPKLPARPDRYPANGKQPMYFYLRPDFPDAEALIRRIDDTIARWRATGRDRAVMGRYIDLSAVPAAP
jgi:hypothetical protein